jgi:hypothetical protein
LWGYGKNQLKANDPNAKWEHCEIYRTYEGAPTTKIWAWLKIKALNIININIIKAQKAEQASHLFSSN